MESADERVEAVVAEARVEAEEWQRAAEDAETRQLELQGLLEAEREVAAEAEHVARRPRPSSGRARPSSGSKR